MFLRKDRDRTDRDVPGYTLGETLRALTAGHRDEWNAPRAYARTLSSRRRRRLWGARDESAQLDLLGRERRPRCEALRRLRRHQLYLQRVEGACRVRAGEALAQLILDLVRDMRVADDGRRRQPPCVVLEEGEFACAVAVLGAVRAAGLAGFSVERTQVAERVLAETAKRLANQQEQGVFEHVCAVVVLTLVLRDVASARRVVPLLAVC